MSCHLHNWLNPGALSPEHLPPGVPQFAAAPPFLLEGKTSKIRLIFRWCFGRHLTCLVFSSIVKMSSGFWHGPDKMYIVLVLLSTKITFVSYSHCNDNTINKSNAPVNNQMYCSTSNQSQDNVMRDGSHYDETCSKKNWKCTVLSFIHNMHSKMTLSPEPIATVPDLNLFTLSI